MNTSLKFAAAAIAGSLAMAAPASALTITQNLSIPQTTTNWTIPLSFNQFDSALGTLLSVQVSIIGSIFGSARLESLDAAPATLTGTVSATQQVSYSLGNIVNVLPTQSTVFNATAHDGTIDFGGTSGVTVNGLSGSAAASNTLTTGFAIAPFIGLGTIGLTIDALGTSAGSGAGNLITQFATSASAGLTVVYDFRVASVDTPEPASMAILGVGMLALGMARRRR